MFKNIMLWIQQHIIASIVIGTVVVGCIVITPIVIISHQKLPDSTYSCKLMYKGKELIDEDVLKKWIDKVSSYDSSIGYDKISLQDFKKELLDEFGSTYIEKKDGLIKLFFQHENKASEYLSYDIKTKQFTINTELYKEQNADAMNTIFNNIVTINQKRDSLSYENFGAIIIIPSIVNNAMNSEINSDVNIDKIWNTIDYKKYTDLGDLVCSKMIAEDEIQNTNIRKNETKTDDNKLLYQKYSGKYIGIGSENASQSYIELLSNGVAYVNINYCGGWSLYKGKYYFTTAEYSGETEIYITSLAPYNGSSIDVPEALFFSVDGNKLFTLMGYLGSNNFDCGVSTDFIKQ